MSEDIKAWWSAYNRGLTLPGLSLAAARSVEEEIDRQVSKGVLPIVLGNLAKHALHKSKRL